MVSTGIPEPATGVVLIETQKGDIEGLKLKDLKAKNYLFQAIDRAILETILCKETSKDIWDSMKKKYQGSARTKRQQLQALGTEFEMLRMKSESRLQIIFQELWQSSMKCESMATKGKTTLLLRIYYVR